MQTSATSCLNCRLHNIVLAMNQPASVCGPIYTIQCNVCRPVIDGELTMIHFSVWLAEHVVRQTGKSINLVARLCSVRLWVSHVAWTQYSDCQLQTIVTLSCMAHNTLCYLWLPLTRSMSLHICCVCLSVCEWVLVLTQSLTDWLTECTNDDGLYISYTTLQAAALSLSLSLSHSFTATACSVAAVSFLAQINSSSRRWFSARRPRHATPRHARPYSKHSTATCHQVVVVTLYVQFTFNNFQHSPLFSIVYH